VNGLGRLVVVEIQKQWLALDPGQHCRVDLEAGDQVRLSAKTVAGELIESQQVSLGGSEHYVYNVAGGVALVEWTAVYGRTSQLPPRELGAPTWLTTRADLVFEEPPRSVSTSGGGATRTVLSAFPERGVLSQLSMVKPEDEARLVAAHVLWDPPGTSQVTTWLRAVARSPHAATLIEQRLRRYPGDIGTRRAQQDVLSGPEQAALCATTATESARNPSNPDLLYLALRCRKDERAVGEQALAAYREHPRHAYLAFAAAHELRRRGDHPAALQALDVAETEPALTSAVCEDIARILRLDGNDTPERLELLTSRSDSLRALLARESGKDIQGPLEAFSLLEQGRLDAAVAAARSEPGLYPDVLALAAASDGASAALIAEALLHLNDVDQPSAMLAATALAEREGARHAELDAKLARAFPDGAELLRFGDKALLSRPKLDVEASLLELSAGAQPYACVVALVRAPELAPSSCRKLATRGLFASERPHFR
jgi:hypothetical protein